jgi:hypothetical protein
VLAVERIAIYGFYVLSSGEMIMRTSTERPEEWIDRFLFVANQLALDFVNTRIVNKEGPLELLRDRASLNV